MMALQSNETELPRVAAPVTRNLAAGRQCWIGRGRAALALVDRVHVCAELTAVWTVGAYREGTPWAYRPRREQWRSRVQ
jgi:hypothetical protein